ncbi:quinohemoprotein amine dehydrogenase subunit gamma [Sphingomonas sp. IW22]|uniref:quinohemoprotein amine dehydrogenase subunit gamma n=1 Tax=Sphingomonas sp. IW22 TaxID=3242489 RepID=UPI0035230C18
MKHLKPINRKAERLDAALDTPPPPVGAEEEDVVALQDPRPHVPMGCTLSFSPGWEVDAGGGTAGLCQPVERDIYDCYVTCFWPVQVPDHVNYSPDWASNCAAATKDWRSLDLVFP